MGVPYTVASKAVEYAKTQGIGQHSRRKKNLFEQNDKVCAVFDRDEHPKFRDAVELCESQGILAGRSDPCFELWLILHDENHDRPDDRHAVQSHFEEMHPEYDADGAKTPDCDELVTRVKQAEERAEAQLERRVEEGDPFGNPSTTVGHLTRSIREADELARRR